MYCEANGSHSRNPENSTMLLEDYNRRISHRAQGVGGGGGEGVVEGGVTTRRYGMTRIQIWKSTQSFGGRTQ